MYHLAMAEDSGEAAEKGRGVQALGGCTAYILYAGNNSLAINIALLVRQRVQMPGWRLECHEQAMAHLGLDAVANASHANAPLLHVFHKLIRIQAPVACILHADAANSRTPEASRMRSLAPSHKAR